MANSTATSQTDAPTPTGVKTLMPSHAPKEAKCVGCGRYHPGEYCDKKDLFTPFVTASPVRGNRW